MRALILLIGIGMHALIAECVQVDGDRIRGADLSRALPVFAGIPADEFIGFSPAIGYQRVFSTRQLTAIGSKFGIEIDSGSEACFERLTQPLNEERILAAMQSELGSDGAYLRVVDFSRYPVPKGSLTFPRSGLVQPAFPQGHSAVLWKGEIRDVSSHITPVWATVLLLREREQIVAAAPIQAGQTVSQEEIRVERVQSFPFEQNAVVAVADLIGKTARFAIRKGQVITGNHVRPPNEVNREDTVIVTVVSPATRMRFSAQAKSPGRAGDWILVQNPISKRNFRAQVKGPGRVSVEVQ